MPSLIIGNMASPCNHSSAARRMLTCWAAGERCLAAGLYMPARRVLETAESIAWRRGDAYSLSRLYLPLLETCRQLRCQAGDGLIVIVDPWRRAAQRQAAARLIRWGAGTMICSGPRAVQQSRYIMRLARSRGLPLEALVLCGRRERWRISSPADPTFAAGLPVRFTRDPAALYEPASPENMTVTLPGPGFFTEGEPAHGLAKESLLAAWEGLALRWQSRHPGQAAPWAQMQWLRESRRIDPACEPVLTRLIQLAEQIARDGG